MINQTKAFFLPEKEAGILSANVVIQHDRERLDGTSPIYLQIIHQRKKKKISLKMWWPAKFFDKKGQFLLPRYTGDPDVNDQNLLIGSVKGRANEIMRNYQLHKRELNLEEFISDFLNYKSKDCFLFYSFKKNETLYEKGINSYRTLLRNKTALNNLQEFVEGNQLPMQKINLEFVRGFDKWLRKTKKYMHNTITGSHKVVKAHINHALADGRSIENPYIHFKTRWVDGEREALEIEELLRLKEYLYDNFFSDAERESLRKFLFSCYSGLRISDSALIHRNQIRNGILSHKMKKGENFGKEVNIPLPNYALELIEGRRGLLFNSVADKTVNEALKVIAAKAGINKRLTFHVARDTFATIFIEMGGDIATLQELMGHSDPKTTMIYIKMSENRKKKLMDNFNKL